MKTNNSLFFNWPPRFIVALILIGVSLLSAIESYAQYTYKHSPIGGGGFVTGIFTHPTSGDRYCRTDVGGAYRWDATNNKWVQLLDWLSDSQVDLYGVEALALDPQNANNVYMLCGTNYVGNGKSAILKSTDKGNTFTVVNLTDSFKVHGNGSGRGNGERLAVDPHNSNILFCGTRANGLWKSTDAGVTWNQVWTGVTTTTNGNGICIVLFDPSSSVVGGATQTIYIGVSRIGAGGSNANFYKSTNGGATFTAMSPTTTYMPHRMALQGTTAYVTFADSEGPATNGTGKVYKLNTGTGAWTDVTPNNTNATPGAWSNFSYGGVSIDPTNVNRVVISTSGMYQNQSFVPGGWGDFVFLSTNGGTNWTLKNGLNATWNNNGIGWATAGGINWMDCIEFDKSNPNIVRHIGGGGVFTCSDITAANCSWKYDVIGIEETALLDGVSIPGGPFISSFGDVTGFVHEPLTSYPTKLSPGGGGNNNSIAYAATNPNKVVRVGDGDNIVYYSNDKGSTWTAAASNVGSAGRVSISADGGTILHCPSWSLTTSYSTNNGASWASCSGVSVEGGAAPVADQVNSNNFYIYSPKNGQFFRSTNKGVSFSEVTAAGASTANYPWEAVLPRTIPGREGHVWIPLGRNGLKYTTNGGSSYTTVANVSYCKSIGIGKTMAGAIYPSVFIWGTVSGLTGLFRSTDQGASWIRINDDAHQFAGAPLLVGDMNVEGRVYMSAGGGRGLIYWDPAACMPTAITPYVQINGGAWTQTANVSVNLGDSVMFGPQPATGGSWSWSGPNGFTASTRDIYIPNIQTNQAGNYVATYTNSTGCQSTQTFVVTVTAPCTPTTIIPYVQVNGGAWQQVADASVASGGSVMFGPQPTTGGAWSWSGPNGFTASTREVYISNIQANQAGNYVATYTNDGGCQSTQTHTLTVSGSVATTAHVQSIVTGTASAGRGKLRGTATVTIYDDLGNVVSGATVTGAFSGTFNETVSGITGSNGTVLLSTVGSIKGSLIVNLCVTNVMHSSLTYAPAQDVITCTGAAAPLAVRASATSIQDEDQVSVEIYPNPAKEGKFNISFHGIQGTVTIDIYDIQGKLVYKQSETGNEQVVVNSKLANGFYQVKVQSETSTITRKLIVK